MPSLLKGARAGAPRDARPGRQANLVAAVLLGPMNIGVGWW